MIFIFFILVVLLPNSVSAEIYQWTDKNGVLNYGNNVPELYRNSADEINVKPNVIKTVKYTQFKVAPSFQQTFDDQIFNNRVNKRKSNKTSCEAQWERYNKSKACFNSCGTLTHNYKGSAIGRNIARCSCGKSINKPHC